MRLFLGKGERRLCSTF